jgi:hypothetical protein
VRHAIEVSILYPVRAGQAEPFVTASAGGRGGKGRSPAPSQGPGSSTPSGPGSARRGYCSLTTADTFPPFDVWQVKTLVASGGGALSVGGTSWNLPVVSMGAVPITGPPVVLPT